MARRKATDIAASLRHRIAAAEWGAALPNERALSREYGVARGTLRDAISALAAEGLVSRHVGRGTMILDGAAEPHEATPDAAGQRACAARRLRAISPRDIMDMRLILEPEAAASAATAASAAQIEAIGRAHDGACAATRMAAFEAQDAAFHGAVVAGTRNALLIDVEAILAIVRRHATMVAIRRRGFTEARRQATCAQHQAILDALERRDPAGAAEAMRSHLFARGLDLFGPVAAFEGPAPGPAPTDGARSDEASADRALEDALERAFGASPRDVMDLRLIVEPRAAALCAASAREGDLARIADAHAMAGAAAGAAFEHWDAAFHGRIFEGTRNDALPALHDILSSIRARAPWRRAKEIAASAERRAGYRDQHAAILDAIAARDAQGAGRAMRAHVESVRRDLFHPTAPG